MEGEIIKMFVKPLSKERFEQKENAQIIYLQQRNCSHELEIDEDIDQHNCEKCGKLFTSHEALLYILRTRMQQLRISSYSLRNEIHFLTEKRDGLKSDIEYLKKEKRTTVKLLKV